MFRPIAPFPVIPRALEEAYGARELLLRGFGSVALDLDLELSADGSAGCMPHLITEVLARCTLRPDGTTVDRQFFWELTVGKRVECLLVLAELSGASELSIQRQCPNGACRQPIEVDVAVQELRDLNREAGREENIVAEYATRRFVLRRPTAADQLAWRDGWARGSIVDEPSAKSAMVRSLVVAGEAVPADLPLAWADRAGELLEAYDPLVGFSVSMRCPFCEATTEQPVDLVAWVFGKLGQAQFRLLEDVHRLANGYHWSEAEILAIPAWRRSRYLDLLDRARSR